MAELDDLKGLAAQLDKETVVSEAALEAYVNYATYAIFTLKEYRYGRDLALHAAKKVTNTVKAAGFTDIWDMERKTKEYGGTYLLDGFYNLCLLRSYWDLEAYMFFMEQDRPQDKRFYLPRMNPLQVVAHDIEDLVNRKIKFLGVSLPARTGKALEYNTPVLTREGWKKHGELKVGDEVIGIDGQFKKVLAVHDPCDMEYKVTFSDKEEIICHGRHEWVVKDRWKQKLVTLETKDMLDKCIDKDGHRRFVMPFNEVVEGEDKDLPVDPYMLGVWLGDGRNTNPDITMAAEDYPVVEHILSRGYEISWTSTHKTTGVKHYGFKGLRFELQKFDMCHSRRTTPKHIPEEYLTASKKQRMDLLAGLLDTDGTLRRNERRYCFTTTEPQLRDDFVSLIHTFGWRTCVVSYPPKTSTSGIHGRKWVYAIGFNPTEYIPCQLERKQLREFSVRKNITVEKVESFNGRGNCITVEDGVYLAGRTLKPTHNSTIAIFGLTWLAMKRPNSHSAMGGHSGVLTKGFYRELLNLIDTSEYRFGQIYKFWHENARKVIRDKSAEDYTINLDKPDRFSTLSCRSIDATWTGAIDVSWDGWLYVDDLVRDREHSLSPTRMENTYQEYLNKMVDRKSGFDPDPRDIDLGFDIDIEFLFPGACELMIGTLWNVYDPLYRMEMLHGDDPLYRFRKIPALNEKDESNFNYPINGFTTEYYREMRERLDEPEWMAKYQQAPFVREGILINRNELNYFNGEIAEPIEKIIGVLDPAVGGGDYLSMVIIAEAKGRKRKPIIDWVYTKETKGKSIPMLVAKIMAHNISEVQYERNGIGRVFDDELTQALHNAGYYRCKMTSFTAPEGMSKEEKIIGYSDWVKQNLEFIDESVKNATYTRSNQYQLALNHVFIWTTEGKNKTDDAIDNLAQTARVYERQRNGIVDVIMNPFR